MRWTALAAALWLAAGCSESRPYADLPQKNLRVRTTAAADGQVALEVYSLNASCNTRYEGYVALDRPAVEVGLPAGKPSLLVFEFKRGQDAHSIKKEVQVAPRAGNRYEANVAYKSSIYDIELREIDPRAGTDLELDTRRRC